MKQFLFQEFDIADRKQMLADNAAKIESAIYNRNLTPDELKQRRKRVCDIDLELDRIDEEVKAFKEEIKDRTSPITSEKRSILKDLRTGTQEVCGKLYKIIDRDTKEVGYYSETGELIRQRRMTAEDNELDMTTAFTMASAM